MMSRAGEIIRIAFTYVGTIVGAGFATGQEILQFFTRYGWIAALTIALSSLLFIWLGIKMMTIAYTMKAKSYEDLNRMLFGPKIGSVVSLFMLVILFGISTVMLAGGGTVFAEQLHLSYQTGLLLTLFGSFWIISRGIQTIMTVNTIVVPIMLLFSCLIVWNSWQSPTADSWMRITTDYSHLKIWTAPFLYTAFNLATSQAVLVPVGASASDKSVIYWGAGIGGGLIGLLLLGAHFSLSSQMPDISQFDIPMAGLIVSLGYGFHILYLLVIFGEIFTTFIADVYGLVLQLEQRTKLNKQFILVIVLTLCYFVSLIGFKKLLVTLYPLFGIVSMIWLTLIIWRKQTN
jgi:uncharacterized membrane protein YkvI